jgi:hypothetical protein
VPPDYPLGAPIRPEKPEPAEEWRALDPSKPWLQTNTRTGMMRNIKPPPSAEYQWPLLP